MRMATATLAALLRDMAERVERGDSLEGNIQYTFRKHDDGPCPDSDPGCLGGEGDDHATCEPQFHEHGFVTVSGSYRIGNLEGQGGVRVIA